MTSRTKISVFIITFNEEKNLSKTLDQLKWCDEIVIVDSFSTDLTVKIAEAYGAKILYRKFDGFGRQKQFALASCQHEWRLSVDADEILDEELINNIQKMLQSSQTFEAYELKRRQVFMGKIFKYGDESARKILRLVKKQAYFTDDAVHEVLMSPGSIGVLNGFMLHDSYVSYTAYIQTMNTYTTLNAEKAFVKNKNYSKLEVIIKPIFQFIRKYFLNLNILNGVEGYYWSKLAATYVFFKCLKVREYHENQSLGPKR